MTEDHLSEEQIDGTASFLDGLGEVEDGREDLQIVALDLVVVGGAVRLDVGIENFLSLVTRE